LAIDELLLNVEVPVFVVGGSLIVVAALVSDVAVLVLLIGVPALSVAALDVKAGATECVVGDIVDAKGAGAGPDGPGGTTGGPPTPYGPGTWVPNGRPKPSADRPLSTPVGIETARLMASATGFGK
jgi:hypothetical protein